MAVIVSDTNGGWDCLRCKTKGWGGHPAALEHKCAGALGRQEGGNHYKGLAVQPVEYIHRNGIGYMEGNAIKYLTRWRSKGGIEDLRKARHYIDLLIEMEVKP